MPQRHWKSFALLVPISALSVAILATAVVQTAFLPLFSWQGLFPFLALFILTVSASRFAVTVAVGDSSQSRKSVADALVFLAVMIYSIPPASIGVPATL